MSEATALQSEPQTLAYLVDSLLLNIIKRHKVRRKGVDLPWYCFIHGAVVAVLVADGDHGGEDRQREVENDAEPAAQEGAAAASLVIRRHRLLKNSSTAGLVEFRTNQTFWIRLVEAFCSIINPYY